jgi:predicted adenylyl cyclase CyaB
VRNIEIKARYICDEKARRVCEEIGAACLGTVRQVDTYFRVPKGRLKLRELDAGTGELIAYVRPDQEGPRCSEFVVINVDCPPTVKEIFSALLGVETVVEKSRTIYILGNARINIDEVDGMGRFLEIEVLCGSGNDEAIETTTLRARELMEAFEITPMDLVPGSYRELRLYGAR